jgi:hypothetical protein
MDLCIPVPWDKNVSAFNPCILLVLLSVLSALVVNFPNNEQIQTKPIP